MPSSPAAGRPFAHLAEYLIALRRAARLPQRALARAASISRSTVQNAESGVAAPAPAVLDAYIRACGGRPDDFIRARRLRARGRTAERGRLRRLDAPDPLLIHTADDLSAALAAVYERAGAPPLRDLNRPGRAPLPPTTAWRIVTCKALPPTERQMMTFLTACGVPDDRQRPYVDAYRRITARPGGRPAPPPARRVAGDRRQVVRLLAEGACEPQHLTPLIEGVTILAPDPAILEKLALNLVPALTAIVRSLDRAAQRNGRSLPEHLAVGLEPLVTAIPHLLPAAAPRSTQVSRRADGYQLPGEPLPCR